MRRQLVHPCRGVVSFCRSAIVTLAILVMILPTSVRAQTDLDTIRSDVRTSPSALPETTGEPTPSHDHRNDGSCHYGHSEDKDPCDLFKEGMFSAGLMVGWFGFTSPYWVPRALLDDGNSEANFPRFPYDDCRGYLVSYAWLNDSTATQPPSTLTREGDRLWSPKNDGPLGQYGADPATQSPLASEALVLPTRRWGGQVRADYGDQFADITMINGQLILETTSRVGLDTSIQYLHERMPDGGFDSLTLGDCNLVYRVAQHPQAQVRMGIGANWLTDAAQTDLGFNFTYGGDFFPCKPWVISTAIDWGTLGHAGLFRFHTTAGVIVNRFETYVGYEYLDIGTTQTNALIAGVRVWF
jgi:hypothetical protein